MMRTLWAIARQTFVQSLRMKVGLAFVVLLVVALASLPAITAAGQAPLSDRIRAFLSYSVWAVMLLLVTLTIFLGASIVAGDVRSKYVFTLASKPVARWQYVIGRWLGIVLLNLSLLAISCTAIYAYAQHMREGAEINNADRRAVETEVFTARQAVGPRPPEGLEQAIAQRVDELRRQGRWDSAVAALLPRTGGNREQAERLALEDVSRTFQESRQSIPPGYFREWTFAGVTPRDTTIEAQSQVLRVYQDSAVAVAVDRSLRNRLMVGGPVLVNGVDGVVAAMGRDWVVVRFDADSSRMGGVAGLVQGSRCRLGVEPMIQLSYKATAGKTPPSGVLRSMWHIDSLAGFARQTPRNDAPNVRATMTLPSRLAGPDGRLTARYTNLPDGDFAATVTIHDDDVRVLYRVGSFTANFLRGACQLAMAMAFMAALAVLAGTFLSFPVACLVCFATLPFSLARDFLADAVSYEANTFASMALRVMSALLPDLGNYAPSQALVAGMNIAWPALAAQAASAGLLAAAALAIACVIYHRRELARVQI
jgi:hypothetical protein